MEQKPLFKVRVHRRFLDHRPMATYEAVVPAYDMLVAAVFVCTKIQDNDLRDVTVVEGQHVPVVNGGRVNFTGMQSDLLEIQLS